MLCLRYEKTRNLLLPHRWVVYSLLHRLIWWSPCPNNTRASPYCTSSTTPVDPPRRLRGSKEGNGAFMEPPRKQWKLHRGSTEGMAAMEAMEAMILHGSFTDALLVEAPWHLYFSHGSPVEAPRKFHESSTEAPQKLCGTPMELPWKLNERSMEGPWKLHGRSIKASWKLHRVMETQLK